MRQIAVFLVVAFLGVVSHGFSQEKEKSLVGKWQMTKSDDKSIGSRTYEFTADGKVEVVLTVGGKTSVHRAVYKLKGKKLLLEMDLPKENEKDPLKKDSFELTIEKLTDKELHLRTPAIVKVVDEYERVPAKKP